MRLKARYFGYKDQTGCWVEIGHEPTVDEMSAYREVEVFYSGYQVERAITHYRSFFEQVGKSLTSLPEWLHKFYFDMQRRIEHEYQTRDARKVSEGPAPISDRRD